MIQRRMKKHSVLVTARARPAMRGKGSGSSDHLKGNMIGITIRPMATPKPVDARDALVTHRSRSKRLKELLLAMYAQNHRYYRNDE